MPETADGYTVNLSDTLKPYFAGDPAADPAVVALREDFKAKGYTQGQFDQMFEHLGLLVEKGIIPPPFNPEAETAALAENGQDGKARQGEQETFLRALLDRKDIDDAAFGELMSLVPSANGVRALEQLRKAMTGPTGDIKVPTDPKPAPGAETEDQKRAREMAGDQRYGRNSTFTKEADALYRKAFG